MPRLLTLAAVVAAVGALGAATATPATAPTNPKHFFWAPGQSPEGTVASVSNDIIYHGGNLGDGAIGVQTKPAVYLVYWGSQWATGFTPNDSVDGKPYSSATLRSYLNAFFTNVGENADKCAWTNDQNIKLGSHQYAIQPMWSNEAFDAGRDGCAVSR
jgi:hypothetical protein